MSCSVHSTVIGHRLMVMLYVAPVIALFLLLLLYQVSCSTKLNSSSENMKAVDPYIQGVTILTLKLKSRFFISNFCRVLNIVCFLLGNSPAPLFYMPTFQNTLSHFHTQVGMKNVGVYVWQKVWLENSEPNLFPYKYPNILNPSHSPYLPTYEDGTDKSVLQHWHIKFRCQGITKKKAYNKI